MSQPPTDHIENLHRTLMTSCHMGRRQAEMYIENLSKQIWALDPALTADRNKLDKVRQYAEDVGLTRVIELLDAPAAAPREG